MTQPRRSARGGRTERLAGARPRAPSSHDAKGPFPIVGVGASAGGLEAFTSLLREVDPATGMAFVLVQHLDPTHPSLLGEALAKATSMPVVVATDGLRIEQNHVYVIPPNTYLGIARGCLTLAARAANTRAPHLPIDSFFRALAAERGAGAVGVILSGSASDGTEGLRRIVEAGGITFAQEPSSAKFSGMPDSAIEAGVVDHCLPVPEIARELGRLGRHPYVKASAEAGPALGATSTATLESIFGLVQRASRIDFREYKSPTFERRLARRMALQRTETVEAYLARLESTPAEVLALAEDALIHVTSFFRDPEAFEALKTTVFPEIVRNRPERETLRVWVAGCSSGEEVYSLAIALSEFLGETCRPVQIFGSDLSARSIEVARGGLYADTAIADMSDERRRRYFVKAERGYRIAKSIRDQCVFVQHDLAHDPPFSRLDLVSCRNVLIYFDQALQKRVLPTFHYALRQPGFLMLGRAESISGSKQLFEVVDRASKIFARTSAPSSLQFARRVDPAQPEHDPGRAARNEAGRDRGGEQRGLSRRLDRLLAGRYAPPGVVVNGKMEVVEVRGETGAYLRPAPGAPQNNVMAMARGGLGVAIRATIERAKGGIVPVRATGVRLDRDGVDAACDVLVIPLKGTDADDDLYLALFEAPAANPRRSSPEARSKASAAPMLEQELAATREYLQTVIEEHGHTNDELGSANEELVSGNEELQSMNEELETAKEELQSINEELTTVNDELQARNLEVTQINGDLLNLLTTVDIPILILDAERRIRRFTPKARQILNVVASDVGRPFCDLKPNIDVPDLDGQIAEVIETMVIREAEVRGSDGHWYRMQIRPYKTTDNRIEGAILSLFDIDALKQHIVVTELATSTAENANDAKDEFLATLSHELRTPLSSMLMRAQLLRRGGMDEAKVKRAGEAIEAGVNAQVHLIDDLLDVSRIVTGKLAMICHVVDLTRLVAAAVDNLRLAAERKSIRLGLDLPSGLTVDVLGDASRLQQVVSNVLANAIKFTPSGGSVTVSLGTSVDSATISVTDTGMGIDPGFLPDVFLRFSQGNITSTRAHGGLGLGLAIARHLVELHHGTMLAESAGLGLGATFSVTLPLCRSARVPPAPGSRPAGSRPTPDFALLGGLRVLVVDDDLATRDSIEDVLTRIGAHVRTAASVSDAMLALDALRPQLLICDIAMPGEDGYTFIRKVRAGGGPYRAVPALALTALARQEDRDRALAAGFQLHVGKPVDMDRLTDAVLQVLGIAGGPSAPDRGLASASAGDGAREK